MKTDEMVTDQPYTVFNGYHCAAFCFTGCWWWWRVGPSLLWAADSHWRQRHTGWFKSYPPVANVYSYHHWRKSDNGWFEKFAWGSLCKDLDSRMTTLNELNRGICVITIKGASEELPRCMLLCLVRCHTPLCSYLWSANIWCGDLLRSSLGQGQDN